ncbi:MAG: hypothetical protein JEZ14_22725 [Marinilabiliaceae bacterium]|nr:hypothetical protein [Marinilabiliaceae bacterium]
MAIVKEEIEVPKAYSWGDIAKKNFKTLDFDGEWLEHLGAPELSGSWTAWGHSGNGKTAYVLQLAKYLTQFTRVHYNTLEEGMRKSFKLALERSNIKSVPKGKFGFQAESYDALVRRLDKKRSANFIVIDSTQYFFRGMSIKHYFELLDHFPNKLFFFVGHAQGAAPKGKLADDIRYHSDIKIHVKDFVAEVQTSRFGGGKPYVVWEQGMRERELQLIKRGK